MLSLLVLHPGEGVGAGGAGLVLEMPAGSPILVPHVASEPSQKSANPEYGAQNRSLRLHFGSKGREIWRALARVGVP